jgi:hypothetical protein
VDLALCKGNPEEFADATIGCLLHFQDRYNRMRVHQQFFKTVLGSFFEVMSSMFRVLDRESAGSNADALMNPRNQTSEGQIEMTSLKLD